MKELEINADYWTVFGDSSAPGQPKNQLIYLGGITFRAISKQGRSAERDDQRTYDKIKEWINRPTTEMGMPGRFSK